MARMNQEINASSTADIAFLLLIFYLVTTTMNVDSGISRRLPPMADQSQPDDGIKFNERNVLKVYISAGDAVMVGGQRVNVSGIKDIAKEFITNPNNDPNLPETEEKEVPIFGMFPVSKGVISLQNDKGTTYNMYIQVQNELTKAYNEVWNELALTKFSRTFNEISEDERGAIRKAIPNKISEAEPVDLAKKKK